LWTASSSWRWSTRTTTAALGISTVVTTMWCCAACWLLTARPSSLIGRRSLRTNWRSSSVRAATITRYWIRSGYQHRRPLDRARHAHDRPLAPVDSRRDLGRGAGALPGPHRALHGRRGLRVRADRHPWLFDFAPAIEQVSRRDGLRGRAAVGAHRDDRGRGALEVRHDALARAAQVGSRA